MLILPATAETSPGFMAAAEAAPDELSTIANVMPCPPMPFVPEEHHGELVIIGDAVLRRRPPTPASAALAPFRALAEPIADMVRPTPYPEMYPPEDPDYHPTAVARTIFLDTSTAPSADRSSSAWRRPSARCAVAQLRVLGGAAARVPADATAYAHRDRRIMVNVAAFYEGHDDRPVQQAWVDATRGRPAARATGRLRELPRRRGRGRRPGRLSGRDVGPARRRSRRGTTRRTCSAATRTCRPQTTPTVASTCTRSESALPECGFIHSG